MLIFGIILCVFLLFEREEEMIIKIGIKSEFGRKNCRKKRESEILLIVGTHNDLNCNLKSFTLREYNQNAMGLFDGVASLEGLVCLK